MTNIKQKFLWFAFLKNFAIATPFLTLYFSQRVKLNQIALLFGVYSFISFLMELPTGVLADRIGEKRALFVSSSIILLGNLFIISKEYNFIILGQVLLGTGNALYSGCFESLQLNSVEETPDKEKTFRTISNATWKSTWTAIILAPLCGSAIARYDISLVMFANIVVSALLIISSLFLPRSMLGTRLQTGRIINKTVSEIKRPSVIRIAFLNIMISASLITIYMLFQMLIHEKKIDSTANGIIYSSVALFGLLGSFVYPKISVKTRSRSFVCALALFALAFVCVGLAISVSIVVAVIFFAILRLVWGFIGPLLSQDLNLEIKQDNARSSTISLVSLATTLLQSLMIIILPQIFTTIAEVFICLGCLLTFCALWLAWKGRAPQDSPSV